MAKIDFSPQRPHELLAVYRDQATAQRVLDLVNERLEINVDARLGDARDEADSLRAEMGEELRESFIAPQAGVIYTKETSKSMLAMAPLAILLGLAIAVPVSFAMGGYSAGTKLAMGVGLGLAFGFTLVLVLGALGAKRPDEPMAAEEGVVVRVKADRDDVRSAMLTGNPIRLDVVDDQGRPIETIARESDGSAARKLGSRSTHWP